jgi:hypothetical protein
MILNLLFFHAENYPTYSLPAVLHTLFSCIAALPRAVLLNSVRVWWYLWLHLTIVDLVGPYLWHPMQANQPPQSNFKANITCIITIFCVECEFCQSGPPRPSRLLLELGTVDAMVRA